MSASQLNSSMRSVTFDDQNKSGSRVRSGGRRTHLKIVNNQNASRLNVIDDEEDEDMVDESEAESEGDTGGVSQSHAP